MNSYNRLNKSKIISNEDKTPEVLALQAELIKVRAETLKAIRGNNVKEQASLDCRARELNQKIDFLKFGLAHKMPTESF